MGFDYLKAIVISVIMILVGYGMSRLCDMPSQQALMMAAVSVVGIFAGIGYSVKSVDYPRCSVNANIVVTLAMWGALIYDFVLCFFNFSTAAIVIPNCIIVLVALLIIRFIYQSKV